LLPGLAGAQAEGTEPRQPARRAVGPDLPSLDTAQAAREGAHLQRPARVPALLSRRVPHIFIHFPGVSRRPALLRRSHEPRARGQLEAAVRRPARARRPGPVAIDDFGSPRAVTGARGLLDLRSTPASSAAPDATRLPDPTRLQPPGPSSEFPMSQATAAPSTPIGVTQPIPRALLGLALPGFASYLLRLGYQWVDALWVRGLGVEATAAVTTSIFVMW